MQVVNLIANAIFFFLLDISHEFFALETVSSRHCKKHAVYALFVKISATKADKCFSAGAGPTRVCRMDQAAFPIFGG
jgi:hypothetical protein